MLKAGIGDTLVPDSDLQYYRCPKRTPPFSSDFWKLNSPRPAQYLNKKMMKGLENLA